MANLFILLFLLSSLCLTIGIMKPSTVIRWGQDNRKTRKNVFKYFGTAIIIFFILAVALSPKSATKTTSDVLSNTTETVSTTNTDSEKEAENTQEVKKVGWVKENSSWYYYDNDGKYKTGWVNDNNKYYYFNSSGIMQKGWIKDNGKSYYCDDLGVRQTGWKESNGKWYYLNSDGTMASNTTVDGYYLASNGAMQEKSVDNANVNTNSSLGSNSSTSVNSGGKQYVDANGNGLIKGSKTHIYHVPGSTYYDKTTDVVQWFKTVEEAEAAGYRAPKK